MKRDLNDYLDEAIDLKTYKTYVNKARKFIKQIDYDGIDIVIDQWRYKTDSINCFFAYKLNFRSGNRFRVAIHSC